MIFDDFRMSKKVNDEQDVSQDARVTVITGLINTQKPSRRINYIGTDYTAVKLLISEYRNRNMETTIDIYSVNNLTFPVRSL